MIRQRGERYRRWGEERTRQREKKRERERTGAGFVAFLIGHRTKKRDQPSEIK